MKLYGIFILFSWYFQSLRTEKDEDGIRVYPRLIFENRSKRDTIKRGKLEIRFPDNSSLSIPVRVNPHLILDKARISGHMAGVEVPRNCFFVGDDEESDVKIAIDACDRDLVRGVLSKDGKVFSLDRSECSSERHHRMKRMSEDETNGYYVDRFWKTSKKRKQRPQPTGYVQSEVVCNGPYCEYFRVKRDEPKWLETIVAIDYSVINFHGKETVARYVLTLLNIVSAIYGDPTLAANLKFVILKLFFYEKPSDCPIVIGRSRKSLENVNKWNKELWYNTSEHERHDIALWLTRLDIGGPSGYAPVAGVCDPARSCSLNKDEGLSSAFIIAHELGHLLGLSHDGDPGASNNCNDELDQGSIMAKLVGATFSYFHWSPCSAGEYHYKSSTWKCMFNYPHEHGNATFIGDVIEFTYSLDDQCRMEFGDGFRFCSSFELSDPCIHLWCSHKSSPELCKTKKGPPMDGTECGESKWCINGYCEYMSRRRKSKDGLRHNSMDGSWSDWSSWRKCSRSCNAGVQFRTRLCDNPRPAYGGAPCLGEREEFRLCNLDPCYDQTSDFRAQQCKDLFNYVSNSSYSRSQSLWYPYEHENNDYKCKLTCFNREKAEYYQSGENVVDGTTCSYDEPSNVCVQGQCLLLGCDKIIGSPVKEDICGVCGGDGTKCAHKSKNFSQRISEENLIKICTIPKGVRNIHVSTNTLGKKIGVSLAIRSRSYSGFLLKNFQHNYTTFVAEGTKFTYKSDSKNETLIARGPLLSPILIYFFKEKITRNHSKTVDLSLRFTISKENDPLFTMRRFEWTSSGWSKCSSKCGGGTQKLIMRCVDKKTGKRIRRHSQCRKSRPAVKVRNCNIFSCDFKWITTRWEDCNRKCGVNGHQIRRIYCVPSNSTKSISDPSLCRGKKRPIKKRPCNRAPCRLTWRGKEWTNCSASACGMKGTRHLDLTCPKTAFTTCGIKPVITEPCTKKCSEPKCIQDESEICKDHVMWKYCNIPSYKEKCCKTCSLIKINFE